MCRKLVYLVIFVTFALIAVPSVTHAQVANLLQNPSFEEDEVIQADPAWERWTTWGWESGLNSTVTFDETESIDGTRSLRIEPTGGTNWYFMVLQDNIPLTVGQPYTSSFWAKAEAERPLTTKMKATDNSVDWGLTDFELTTEWAEYSMTANAMSASAKFEIHCAAVDAPLWVDFVFVYEGEYVAGIEPAGATPQVKATDPNPTDGAVHEDTWVNLSWRPGNFAVSHDVYLGDNFDDVNNGTGDTFRGNQTATFSVAGFPGFAFPDGLVPGTTYYWRIDEVNEADPNSPWKGDVWSFSVPPKTAYDPDPPDGAGFVDPNATFSWTGGYGAKLHTIYIGTNIDDVNDAVGGAPQGTANFSPGPLESEKVYYWRVDEFDAFETHKGDIWSFTTPGAVGNPQPANGIADVPMTAALSWTPADNAASSELYFGTDADAVKNATPASPEYIGNRALGSESHDPGKLALGATYHWRVDAVYPAETVKGLLWSFSTADFIGVDDFESYNDIDPPDAASNRIFDIWIDGFGTTTNGALVGNDLPPYAEQLIVHGGIQSLPYRYDNANKTSEATLTLVYPRDWTEEGVTKLSLWFRGASGNSAERMFVVLNGGAPVYHDDPAVTQTGSWTEWVIDLAAFGADLTNVNTITIGFGTKGSPAADGGTGTMYFDDIRLYR
ncbi:MAG: hypothetical protein CEE38_17155 [Planctomycetes bacterium B3_Pla]|nr:MAG: hypothetical protein CEE38_17155 [Planctomycetes bacterium B3_Pla]